MSTHAFFVLRTGTLPVHYDCWHAARACSGCIIFVVMSFSTGPLWLSGDHNVSFSRAYKKAIMNSVVVRLAMSIGQFLLLIIQTLMSPIFFFFSSMCFESKTRVSTLVPCVVELHLELRRFRSWWGSAGIRNTGESALLLCRTYATIAYVRDNAVCRMKYAVREYASSLLSFDMRTLFLLVAHDPKLGQDQDENGEFSCTYKFLLNKESLYPY